MFPSLSLGRILGFPVRVNASFMLLLAVLAFLGHGVTLALVAGVSVILHELGHALAARRLGVPVAGIELHFFGGAAQITDMPRRPNDEMVIAAAGPAVSFALAGAGYLLALVTGAGVSGFLALVAGVNLMLAVFNLLPVFPSDGGRILRAFLARKRGLVGATDLAVKVGRVLLVGLVLLGLSPFGSFQMVVVAIVLWMMGSAERRGARLRGDQGAWRGEAPQVEYFPPNSPAPPPRTSSFPGASFYTRNGRVVLIWHR